MQASLRGLFRGLPPPARVLTLVSLVLIVDVAVLATMWTAHAPLTAAGIHPLLILALVAAVEWRVVHIHLRSETSSFSLLELPLVLGVLYVPPRHFIVAAAVGVGLGLLVGRRQPPLKVAFNMANVGLYAAIATTVVHTALRGDELTRWNWLVVFTAIGLGSLISMSMIVTVITLTEGPPSVREAWNIVSFGLGVSMANTAISIVAALLVPIDVLSLALLAVPAMLLFLAFRVFISEQTQRERMDFLYRRTKNIDLEANDDGLDLLLDEARAMFRAEISAILRIGEEPSDPALLIRSTEPGRSAAPADAELTSAAIGAAAAALDQARIVGLDERHVLSDVVWSIGASVAMVAPLATDETVIGLLVIADRRGDVARFGADDLKVLDALAHQSSVQLHSGRLEQAVDELRQTERQLAHEATHDTLTGLANRTLFARHLDEAAGRGGPFTVLFIDLDDFKAVNDNHGHSTGDAVLVEAANRMVATVRPVDVVARLGGDEFAVLLRHHPTPDKVVTRIVEAIRAPMPIEGDLTVGVGCSIGLANSDAGADPQAILDSADHAMYQVKRSNKGGDRPLATNTERRAGHGPARRSDADGSAPALIPESQLELYYQPIFRPDDEVPAGIEALVRWHCPQRGLVLPDAFLAAAEANGAVVPLDRWVLRRAWADLCALDHPDLFVSVNVSGRHLHDPDLLPFLRSEVLGQGSAPDGRLVLELSETALHDEVDHGRGTLEDLQAVGIRAAVDNFGLGASSIGYLREFAVDLLKIARPLTAAAITDRAGHQQLSALVGLGRALGLEVVVEGVEDRPQAGAVARTGPDLVQGFHYGRPVPLAQMKPALRPGARSSDHPDAD